MANMQLNYNAVIRVMHAHLAFIVVIGCRAAGSPVVPASWLDRSLEASWQLLSLPARFRLCSAPSPSLQRPDLRITCLLSMHSAVTLQQFEGQDATPLTELLSDAQAASANPAEFHHAWLAYHLKQRQGNKP